MDADVWLFQFIAKAHLFYPIRHIMADPEKQMVVEDGSDHEDVSR